jgi:ABC-2 type transport system ATP-binding protein
VAAGSGTDLKAAVADRTIVEIETFGVTEDAIGRVRADPDVIAVNTEDADQSQIILVQSERGTEITQRLIQHLGDTRIGKISAREPTLEDAYVHLIATTGGENGDGERATAVA